MPKKKVKVKTKAEDIGDLSVASYLYSMFREQDQDDTTPEPEGSWSEWHKPRNARKRVTHRSTADNPWVELDPDGAIREVDRSFTFDKTHPFRPGKSKF